MDTHVGACQVSKAGVMDPCLVPCKGKPGYRQGCMTMQRNKPRLVHLEPEHQLLLLCQAGA